MCVYLGPQRERASEGGEGGEEPGGGGGATRSEVNQPGLCLSHFLAYVKVNQCRTQGIVHATMGLCCSEKARKFGVSKGCAEVRTGKGSNYIRIYTDR